MISCFGWGCAAEYYQAETRLNSDGSVERTIRQPDDPKHHAALKAQGWRHFHGFHMDETEDDLNARNPAAANSDSKEPDASKPDYFEASGRFNSIDQIPAHFKDAAPDGVERVELIRNGKRKDLVFVVEHRWSETLTDTVRLADIPRTSRELAKTFIDIWEKVLKQEYGAVHDIQPVVDWLRGEGTDWFEELALAFYEVHARRSMQHQDDEWVEAELKREWGRVSAAHGLAEFNEAAARELAAVKLRDLLRKKDGTPAEETTIEAILTWHGMTPTSETPQQDQEDEQQREDAKEQNDEGVQGDEEQTLKQLEKEIVKRKYGSTDAFETRIQPLVRGIIGAYPFSAAQKFNYTLTMPGEIVEMNGTLVTDKQIRWTFNASEAYPLGYTMSARSLEVVSDLKETSLEKNPLSKRADVIEFASIVAGDDELLELVRKFAKTGRIERNEKHQPLVSTKEEDRQQRKVRRLLQLLQPAAKPAD
jgi:hypothetical protein